MAGLLPLHPRTWTREGSFAPLFLGSLLSPREHGCSKKTSLLLTQVAPRGPSYRKRSPRQGTHG